MVAPGLSNEKRCTIVTLTHERSYDLYADAEELAAARDKIANLETALLSSRLIGMAIGVVVERCRLGADDAFRFLVSVSQHEHRKLRDIAADLVYTGIVPRQS